MSNSKGSHRAARGSGRTAVARPPAPLPAAAPASVPLHERLTLAAWAVHAPTVVDLPSPGRPPATGATGGRVVARRAAPRHRAPAGPESLRRLVPQALVVAFLAGGTTAFVACDKAVTLDVDGRPRTLHTFASEIDEFLADEGITLAARDSVTPALGSGLADGDEVVVRPRR
ncbi:MULTISPECIES: ubiquitin-like domain-containing protein [unclassified Streptomyces]|uniref:ubiquitin-like domain-containing protein n=1 Tax=unclassified Streptomyces TaxID=2593676 RepID=UPI00352DFE24